MGLCIILKNTFVLKGGLLAKEGSGQERWVVNILPKWDRDAISNSGSPLAGLLVLICRERESASLSSASNTTLRWARAEQISTC